MKTMLVLLLTICSFTLASRWDQCSRDRSRYARRIIEENILPSLRSYGLNLPESCPLKPMGDFFARQDQMMVVNSAQDWACDECGKRFRSSHFLINHFFRRHNTSVIDKVDTVCLADYCPLLRCDVFHEEVGSMSLTWRAVLCREEHISSLRPQCHELVNKCSTGNGSVDLKWTDTLQKLLCEPLTIDAYWRKPENIGSEFAVAQWIAVILGLIGYFVAVGIRIVRIDSRQSKYRRTG